MASRNYGMAFDTPYNEQLLRVLEKYDRERDTNGEPDIFGSSMEGGAFLGADGRVHTTGMYHPHLSHPMLGSMAREMDGGKFNFGKALGSVAKGVGKVALPIATKVGTKVAEDALMSALAGAGKKPRGRPRKMVSGANSAMGASGGKFSLSKSLGSVAKGVGKIAVPIATKVGTKMAEDAVKSYMSGEGVMSAGVGEMKRPRGRPRKTGGKFDIFDPIIKIGKKAGSPFEKSVGVNPFTMGFDLGKDVIAPALMGKGVRSGGGDGRKARAEIVKKVMKEHGLKMTDASKFVKQHGLY